MIPSPVINPPVIQRSLALAGRPPVRYREGVAVSSLVPSRPLQLAVAASISGINGGLSLLAKAPAGVRRAGAGAMKARARRRSHRGSARGLALERRL